MISRAASAVGRHPLPLRLAIIVILLAAVALVPAMGSAYYTALALNIIIFGILAMSLDLLAGYTGLVSMGQASFLGVGAYGLAYGMGSMKLTANASILLALAAVLVAALVFGLMAIRVRELTFVILTLALGQIVWGLAYRWDAVSGGDNGLAIVQRPLFGPFDLTQPLTFYYFTAIIFAVSAFLLWVIINSPFGLTLRGIRDNEMRMRTLGYRVWLHKYVAFVISAFFAGVSGILYGFYNQYVSPTTIDFPHNGIVVLMVIVGGMGTLWGALVGSTMIVLLEQYVSIYVTRWETLMGVLLVLIVLFSPDGVWGGITRLVRALFSRSTAAAEASAPRAELSIMGKAGEEH